MTIPQSKVKRNIADKLEIKNWGKHRKLFPFWKCVDPPPPSHTTVGEQAKKDQHQDKLHIHKTHHNLFVQLFCNPYNLWVRHLIDQDIPRLL